MRAGHEGRLLLVLGLGQSGAEISEVLDERA